MADLNAKKRAALPKTDFAGPGRSYPVNDANHARLALAMVAKYGSPAEQKKVRAAVAKKFPSIDKKGK